MDTVNKQLEYMYGLERFGVKMGLDVMERLLKELGNPEKKFRSVHISGTNGKGSVASMMASVLQEANYTVGLYTSPHMYRFNERIQVDGKQISDEELSRIVEEVRLAGERANVKPTFFEFTTAVAFVYFASHNLDICIIEVGMGGTLDATNVVIPEVSVITNIGLDHTNLLGNTKQEIAERKAGIVKQGVAFVTGERDEEILNYFAEVADSRSALLLVASDHVQADSVKNTLESQTVVVRGVVEGEFILPLLGQHQVENLKVALTALTVLEDRGFEIPHEAYREGVAHTKWEGRFDVISDEPLMIVDGAHNDDGIHALIQSLTSLPAFTDSARKILVLGVKKDRDLSPIVSDLVPLFDEVVTTEGIYEPMPADDIAAAVLSSGFRPAQAFPNVYEAHEHVRGKAGNNDAIIYTGSLYMIAAILQATRGKTN